MPPSGKPSPSRSGPPLPSRRAAGLRGEGAHVGQLRVVVHEVERELGSVVELLGVVAEREAVLAAVARLVVGQAVHRQRGGLDARQRVVLRSAQAVRVFGRAAEVHVGLVHGVVGADHVAQVEEAARRGRFHRPPFELVVALDRGVLERLEARVGHRHRREHFLHLEADAPEVGGRHRLRLVDGVDHQQGRLAPVHDLAAESLTVSSRSSPIGNLVKK